MYMMYKKITSNNLSKTACDVINSQNKYKQPQVAININNMLFRNDKIVATEYNNVFAVQTSKVNAPYLHY